MPLGAVIFCPQLFKKKSFNIALGDGLFFHTGHSYVQSLPELYPYQNYTYIRIIPVSEQGVAGDLIPSEATTQKLNHSG